MAQYVEELLGQFTTVGALDGIGAIEQQQAVGTRMLLVLNFRWRFPLFEQLASGFNWILQPSKTFCQVPKCSRIFTMFALLPLPDTILALSAGYCQTPSTRHKVQR